MMGQCTDYPNAKLESLPIYASMKESFDVFTLIKLIKGINYVFEENMYHLQALHDSKIRFYALRQGKDVSNVKFLEIFQTHVDVLEQFGGEIGRDPIICANELELEGLIEATATDEQTIKTSKEGKEKYLAMSLIRASDQIRYRRLMDHLQNQFTMGYNNFPTNVTVAYNLIINYRVTGQSIARIINDSEGVLFTTVEKGVAFAMVKKVKEKCDYSKIKCFQCQQRGHFANHCPENEEDKPPGEGGEVTEALQQLIFAEPPDSYETYDEFMFHQTHRHVKPNWIILDTASTNDIFYNKKLVSNI
jgi:hypothetical protein